jgi:hypothetical protein
VSGRFTSAAQLVFKPTQTEERSTDRLTGPPTRTSFTGEIGRPRTRPGGRVMDGVGDRRCGANHPRDAEGNPEGDPPLGHPRVPGAARTRVPSARLAGSRRLSLRRVNPTASRSSQARSLAAPTRPFHQRALGPSGFCFEGIASRVLACTAAGPDCRSRGAVVSGRRARWARAIRTQRPSRSSGRW